MYQFVPCRALYSSARPERRPAADTNAERVCRGNQAATKPSRPIYAERFTGLSAKACRSLGYIAIEPPDSLCVVLTIPLGTGPLCAGTTSISSATKRRRQGTKLEVRNGKPTQNVQFSVDFFQNGCTNFCGAFDTTVGGGADTENGHALAKPSWLFPLRSVENVIVAIVDVRSMRIGLYGTAYITYEFAILAGNQPLASTVFEVPKRMSSPMAGFFPLSISFEIMKPPEGAVAVANGSTPAAPFFADISREPAHARWFCSSECGAQAAGVQGSRRAFLWLFGQFFPFSASPVLPGQTLDIESDMEKEMGAFGPIRRPSCGWPDGGSQGTLN